MDDLSAFKQDDGEIQKKAAEGTDCELLLIEQGGLVIGVLAAHVDSVVPWSSPAVLPKVSPFVVGVIQDRGRIVAVRRAEKQSGPAQRIVLCRTSKGLVGIPATGARDIGTVRVFGGLSYGRPLNTDHGTLTILDLESVADEMTQ